MRFELATLLTHPCPNLWHDLLAAGCPDGAAVIVDDHVARTILARCEQPPPPQPAQTFSPAPSPVSDWPRWAKALRARRRPGETGVGDTLERLLAPLGASRLAAAYERLAGRPCGCHSRQAWLNQRYVYSLQDDPAPPVMTLERPAGAGR